MCVHYTKSRSGLLSSFILQIIIIIYYIEVVVNFYGLCSDIHDKNYYYCACTYRYNNGQNLMRGAISLQSNSNLPM